MVIDEGKLTALLVEKTGSSKEEIQQQLSQLKQQIIDAAESGRQFHVEGFGTFGQDEGSLYFEPASQLKTEINQKYAGMKPIELMAAFKETGAGVPVEEITTEPPVKKKPAARKPEKSKKTTRKKEKKKEPVAAPLASSSAKKKKTKQKPAAKAGKKKKVASGAKREESDTIGTVLVAAVVIIAILAGGWFLYDSGVFSTSGSNNNLDGVPADTTGQNIDQPTQPIAGDSVSSSGMATDSTEQNTTNDVSANEPIADGSNATYGLKGSVNEQAENAYTIVIHSFRLQSTVQEIADSLNQQGYRTVLFEGIANGESRWRLGLGQFENIEDAQAAVQELSAPYKENHFIKRI